MLGYLSLRKLNSPVEPINVYSLGMP